MNAFINACSHRGAQLCRHKRGNKATYTCPFHGWTFNNSGKLLKVKDPEDAGYSECFNKEGSHDLKKVARFESYKGFLFGSVNENVVPLTEFLGEAGKIIDMIVNQSADGLEVLRQIKSDDKFNTIPVVILASSREEANLGRSYQLGANSYVVKPVDSQQFADAIRQLGKFWAVVNEPPQQRAKQ